MELRDFRRSAAVAELAHTDDVGRIDDADVEMFGVGMPGELIADDRLGPRQQQTEIEMAGSSQRAVDDAAWRMVAAHRVYGNFHEYQQRLRTQGSVKAQARSSSPEP